MGEEYERADGQDEKALIDFLVRGGIALAKAFIKVHPRDGDRCGLPSCREEWPCSARRRGSKALRRLRARARRERRTRQPDVKLEPDRRGAAKARLRGRRDLRAGEGDDQTSAPDVAYYLSVPAGSVYAVHAIREDEITATEVIWTDVQRALPWAASMSTDPGVLAAAVTQFVVDQPGHRHAHAMFVKGRRQNLPHLSDDRTVAANGWITDASLRPRARKVRL